jgi:hypothetical protein
LLKENGAAAMIRFEKALMLSKQLGDKVRLACLGMSNVTKSGRGNRSARRFLWQPWTVCC